MIGRRGKMWETEVRNMLVKDFKSVFVYHITNTEHLDFVVFCKNKTILCEAKKTRNKHYYTKNSIKLRNQLKKYFELKQFIETKMEFPCEFWMYIKKVQKPKSIIIKRKFESYGEIPNRL